MKNLLFASIIFLIGACTFQTTVKNPDNTDSLKNVIVSKNLQIDSLLLRTPETVVIYDTLYYPIYSDPIHDTIKIHDTICPEKPVPGVPVIDTNKSIKTVIFYQNFEDNTPGKYLRSEWEKDWFPHYSLSDPRAEYWDSYGQLKIITEGTNKFFRRESKAGEYGTGMTVGCNWFVDIEDKEELYYSFKVRFPQSMFNQGKHIEGKINGLYNPSNSGAGQKPGPNTGFNTLMMFQNTEDFSKMEIFLYIYYQEMRSNDCMEYAAPGECPESKRIYWGNYSPVNFLFDPDKWYTITQRLVMNDPYTSNGIIEIFIDGKLIASYNHYRFRDTKDIKIEYLEVSNFFGGNKTVSSAFDTYFDFDDFEAFYYKPETNILTGTKKSLPGRILE